LTRLFAGESPTTNDWTLPNERYGGMSPSDFVLEWLLVVDKAKTPTIGRSLPELLWVPADRRKSIQPFGGPTG